MTNLDAVINAGAIPNLVTMMNIHYNNPTTLEPILKIFMQMSTHLPNTIQDLFQNNLPDTIFKVIEANMTDVNTLTMCLHIIKNLDQSNNFFITPEKILLIQSALLVVFNNSSNSEYDDMPDLIHISNPFDDYMPPLYNHDPDSDDSIN